MMGKSRLFPGGGIAYIEGMDMETLTVTARAADALKSFVARNGRQVRLEINPGGCSGFDIVFAAGEPREGDVRLGPAGAELLVDAVSYELVAGATVDFLDQIGKEGFVVEKIPNMEARCGCGKSFSLAD